MRVLRAKKPALRCPLGAPAGTSCSRSLKERGPLLIRWGEKPTAQNSPQPSFACFAPGAPAPSCPAWRAVLIPPHPPQGGITGVAERFPVRGGRGSAPPTQKIPLHEFATALLRFRPGIASQKSLLRFRRAFASLRRHCMRNGILFCTRKGANPGARNARKRLPRGAHLRAPLFYSPARPGDDLPGKPARSSPPASPARPPLRGSQKRREVGRAPAHFAPPVRAPPHATKEF